LISLTILHIYLIVVTAIIGACIGSFLNVVIYRLPLKQSIAFPASHCPFCKNKIKFYDNIPLLSYILLSAKCRHCKHKISFRYFFIELITCLGFVFILINNNYNLNLVILKNVIFLCSGLAIIFIDMKHFIIPDVISIPLIIIGIVISFFIGNFKDSIAGALIGFISFFLIALIYYLMKKEEGLGGGDIKYITAIGAFVGVIGTLFVMFFASIIALFGYFIFLKKTYDKQSSQKQNINQTIPIIPYGIFLGISSILYMFFGDIFTNWYLSLLY